MEQSSAVELTPISGRLLGATVTGLGRLAAVADDGQIPLTGTLVLESELGYVTLSYSQTEPIALQQCSSAPPLSTTEVWKSS